MSALENNPKINATIKSINAGRQLFSKICFSVSVIVIVN